MSLSTVSLSPNVNSSTSDFWNTLEMGDFEKLWACNKFLIRMSTDSTETFKKLTEDFEEPSMGRT